MNADGTGSGAGGSVNVQDSGFESPDVGIGLFGTNPPDPSPWTYTGNAGVSGNEKRIHRSQRRCTGGRSGRVPCRSRAVSVRRSTSAAGSYSLSFLAAQRAGDAGVQTIQLMVDGNAVGAPVQPQDTSYQSLDVNFWVSAGNHTIALAGLDPNGGDNTAFIDAVSITNISGTLAHRTRDRLRCPRTPARTRSPCAATISRSTRAATPAFVGASPIVGGPARATLTTVDNPWCHDSRRPGQSLRGRVERGGSLRTGKQRAHRDDHGPGRPRRPWRSTRVATSTWPTATTSWTCSPGSHDAYFHDHRAE